MGILQTIVNEDTEYRIATAILREDLPRFDECDPDERETFITEIRWALAQKVRQMVLLHAFREDPNGDDVPLEELAESAGQKVHNPSFIASVQEFVLRDLGIDEQRELHPIPEMVERETAVAYANIMAALAPIMLTASVIE